MNDFNLPGEPSFDVLGFEVPRTPLRPMAPAELEVREYLSMSCLPVRSPSPVGWAADEFQPASKVEKPPFTYPPSFAHTILAGGGLTVDFDFDELLLPELPQPRFASPLQVSPHPDGGASPSTMGSPERGDVCDVANCDSEEKGKHCEVEPTIVESGEEEGDAECREEAGTQQEGEEEEEADDDDDDEEGEELVADTSTGKKRKRTLQEVCNESDAALKTLIGESTPLMVDNHYRCRWTMVFGGDCTKTFKTQQTHDRHVCSHVPDVDGATFKAFKCRLRLIDPDACTRGSGTFSRRDPCQRHIGGHSTADLRKLDGKNPLYVRRRPWWWPSPLFLTSTFNLKDERLTARPSGEIRTWLEFLREVLVKNPGAVNLHGGSKDAEHAPIENDADTEPSRRRSKRLRRS